MKNNLKYTFIFLAFCLISTSVFAQTIDDWEARPTLFVKYNLNNNLAFEAKYEHRLDQNFSHFKKSVVGLKVNYKIEINPLLTLKPGLDYRLSIDSKKTEHDFRYFAALNYRLNNELNLKYKPIFQHLISHKNNPEGFLRNEIELNYEPFEKWAFFLFTENYQLIKKGLRFDTQKYGAGFDYRFNSKNEFEFKFDIKHKTGNENSVRIQIGYIYIIK